MEKKSIKQKQVPAPAINKMLGTYEGKELQPFANRSGAMDAYKLPSMFQGKPFFRGQFK